MNIVQPDSNPFYFKLAMVLVSLISLGYLSIVGKEILAPLLFALLIAILILPVCIYFEKRFRLPRSVAAGLSVTLLLLAISLIIYFIGSQVSGLRKDLPLFKAQVLLSLTDIQNWISSYFHVDLNKHMDYIDTSMSRLLNVSTTVLGTTVVTVSSLMLFLIFTLIDTFFLLIYRRLILKFLVGVFREENAKTLYEVVAQIQLIIRKYILGLLLQMGIIAGTCCLAFWLLDIKYAILLGLLTGLFNIIPYIGILSALLLSTLITFATGATAAKILLVVAIVVVVHLVDSNILLPLVVGSKVRINALITLLCVIAGEMMWGITGMFLAIPVIAIAKIIFDRIEGLQPWGVLLGAEHDDKKPLSRRYRVKKVIKTEH